MNRTVFTGDKPYFPEVKQINYEGPDSDNPLAFKAYDPDRMVAGKKMEEHLRFAVCYWHSFCANGATHLDLMVHVCIPGTYRVIH